MAYVGARQPDVVADPREAQAGRRHRPRRHHAVRRRRPDGPRRGAGPVVRCRRRARPVRHARADDPASTRATSWRSRRSPARPATPTTSSRPPGSRCGSRRACDAPHARRCSSCSRSPARADDDRRATRRESTRSRRAKAATKPAAKPAPSSRTHRRCASTRRSRTGSRSSASGAARSIGCSSSRAATSSRSAAATTRAICSRGTYLVGGVVHVSHDRRDRGRVRGLVDPRERRHHPRARGQARRRARPRPTRA